jgi:glycosyltransferase involved in cell wall biosynthesis
MHKVLVIAYYFPPMGLSGVQRTLKFVKYLKLYGWEPTVITTGDVAYFAHDESLQKELEETRVRVIRVAGAEPNSLLSKHGTIKLPSEFVRKIFNRLSQTFFIPDNKISWAKRAFQKAIEILSTEHFDCVFISGPPFSQFDAFSSIKKVHNIPLILDYRDLWYDSYFAFYPTPFHRFLHKKKEYKALKTADRIIVTNRKIKEKLLNTFPFLTFDDIVIIPHGYDPEDFDKTSSQPKISNKMVLMYSGIFMEYNTPEYFLRAFKQLTIEKTDIASNIELHFVGFLGKENKKLISNLKLQSFIKDHGYMNHDETITKLISSDVLWLMVGKRKNIDAILPGKMNEYFGTKKPIIACVPDGAAKLAATEYKAAFITEPDNVNQIKDVISLVYKLYKDGSLPTPDENFINSLRRDLLTEQFAKQLNKFLRV